MGTRFGESTMVVPLLQCSVKCSVSEHVQTMLAVFICIKWTLKLPISSSPLGELQVSSGINGEGDGSH